MGKPKGQFRSIRFEQLRKGKPSIPLRKSLPHLVAAAAPVARRPHSNDGHQRAGTIVVIACQLAMCAFWRVRGNPFQAKKGS